MLRRTDARTNSDQFRQTEIENFGVSSVGHEYVGRLDVSMDDALGVGGIERVRNLDAQSSSFRSASACLRCDVSVSRRPETPWR